MESSATKTINMVSGGRTGDFLHQLYVPKILYATNGIKTNLFVASIGDQFYGGLEKAYDELKPVVEQQEYINTFSIYRQEHIDVNLSSWRQRNPQVGWTKKLAETYFGSIPIHKNLKILTYSGKRKDLEDCLLINRSLDTRRYCNNIERYTKELNKFPEDKRFFLYTDPLQYQMYAFRDKVRPLFVPTLSEMCLAINSCRLFLGNLSAPLAIAYCLGTPLVAEFGDCDVVSYKEETTYHDNISWFDGK